MKKTVLLIATTFITGASFAQLPASPLAIYEFTSGSLNNTAPTSAQNFTGSIVSIADRDGNSGDAADVTGQLVGANFGGANVVNTTLAFWMKSASVTSLKRVLQVYGDNGAGYRIEMSGTGLQINCDFETMNGPVTDVFVENQEVDDASWHHVAVRTTETGASDGVQFDLFVDGSLTSTGGVIGTGSLITNFLTNGSFRVDPLNEYGGDIDDIYVYNRSLSNAEVTEVYNHSSQTSVGLSENGATELVEVYPNPTTGVVTFSSAKEVSSIEVYSLTGQKVSVFNNRNTIDISSLPRGVYTARVIVGSSTPTIERLVKK